MNAVAYNPTQTRVLGTTNFVPNRMTLGQTRFAHRRPRTNLGASGPQLLTSTAATGGSIAATQGVTAALTAIGAGGAVIGSVVPVVGTIVGALIGGLLSGHFQREAGAKNENQALNGIFPLVYQDIVSTMKAYMAGQVSASDAIQVIQQIGSNYWQTMAKYQTGPGQHAVPCTGTPSVPAPNVTPTPCNKQCTASCCIGCNVVQSWINQATTVLQNGSGTIQFGSGGGSKYGFKSWSYPALTVTAPPASALSTSAAGLVSELTDSSSGFPLWALLLGGFLFGRYVL